MSFENPINEIEKELSEKFLDKKMDTGPLIESYKRLGMEERAEKVFWCGTELHFRFSEDLSAPPKLFNANFCKDRLCLMCSWRRSLKIFGQVSKIMDELQNTHQFQFVFVTFTIRNCSGYRLSSVLDRFAHAFHLFNQRTRVKRAFKGCFKTIEITYHPEYPADLRFHPHFHCIFAVNKSYFKNSTYITHDELMSIWRECLDIGYDPHVDIRKVKPSVDEEGDLSLSKAVSEVAKYCVKPGSLFVGRTDNEIDFAVSILSAALAGRRLCSFTGVFKKVAKQLKLDDLIDGDLVLTDNEKVRSDVGYLIATYKWQVGFGYQLAFVRHQEREENKK